MDGGLSAVRISDHVYWVGAIDWNIRDFHGYTTRQGSTYNAYLVLADKITLIDTVKAPFRDELLSRISSVIDPASIDYIVSNHSEMDHSGCLVDIIGKIKPERVFASKMGAKALFEHFGLEDVSAVVSNENLNLGNLNLEFLETRMLHWPDSMFSYLREDGVLFSQDAFGMHLASHERFADEIPPSVLEYEMATYYANILMPYSPQILKLIDTMSGSPMAPVILAPDHGPVHRRDIDRNIERYRKWALQEPTDKAVVIYDTMWHSTETMARVIAEGIVAQGARAKILAMSASHRSEAAFELLDAGALIVGSPTLNNNIFPTMADVMTYLKGLRPRNLVSASFGSFGWGGEAPGQLRDILDEMKTEIVSDPLRVRYVPARDDILQCHEFGRLIGKKLG